MTGKIADAREPSGSGETSVLPEATHARIVDAAVRCFETYGLERMRTEDVARMAGVSRPTVYRGFPDRAALVTEVMVREAQELNRRIFATVPLDLALPEALFAIFAQTLLFYESNPHRLSLLDEGGIQRRAAHAFQSDRLLGEFRNRWTPYLERAARRGELERGLNINEIVHWLSVLNASMLMYRNQFDDDHATLKRYYLTFVTPAIVRRTGK